MMTSSFLNTVVVEELALLQPITRKLVKRVGFPYCLILSGISLLLWPSSFLSDASSKKNTSVRGCNPLEGKSRVGNYETLLVQMALAIGAKGKDRTWEQD
jgi:hypothetical protein